VKKINYPNIPDKERAMAMDRALFMTKLFQKQHFDKIIAIINQYYVDVKNAKGDVVESEAEDAFIEVCDEAGIIEEEREWLWNYLQNYKPAMAEWTARANPGVGW
jgi:hypothetical protein